MTSKRACKIFFLCAAAVVSGQPVHAQNFAYPLVSSAPLGYSRPFIWIAGSVDPSSQVYGPGQTTCSSSTNICYYFPSDIRTAYAVSSILNGNGGAGQTVAIVDAYSNTQTEADLAAFSSQFGLPACSAVSGCLTFVNQAGGATLPGCSASASVCQGWFGEQDLDVQWVHAIAPNAKILVVCANTASTSDLLTGVATAYATSGVVVVTNSWGGPESSGETLEDSTISASTIPVLFSTGDQKMGESVDYPAISPFALAVGGTHLLETATSYRNVEGAWGEGPDNGAGGACSVYEGQPSFQNGFATVCGSFRGAPDVALIADPFTGVLTYLGSNAGPDGAGFYIVGGTSLASPVMAGLIANIDTARVTAGKAIIGGPNSTRNLVALLYAAAANPFYHYRFYDVTTLTNNFYPAGAGWDRASGLGVPMGPALTAYLVGLP